MQPQCLKERLSSIEDVEMAGLRLIRSAVGEEFHLVELMHSQQAAGIAPGGAGLSTEAGGLCGEANGEFCLGQDLAAMHRSQRDLGSGNSPQVISLHEICLF